MDTTRIILCVLLVILLVVSALFSATETAYSSVTRAKIEEGINPKKTLMKKTLIKRYEMFPSTLSTLLIGNNLVNVCASTILSTILSSVLTDDVLEIVISTAVMTPLIVIFGEILPKMFALKFPLGYLKRTYLFLSFFYILFWPITILISKLVKPNPITNTEGELKHILNTGYEEGVLEKEESILAINALDFDSVKLTKHYVRLKNITYISYEQSLSEILNIFRETRFSRLPVLKNKKFVGIILLKDIFFLEENEFEIDNFIIEVPYISSNSLLKIALKKMKEYRSQFAFVTKNNDDKNVIGIITFEDAIEEIVGEIYDEHDFRDDLEMYELDESKLIVRYSTDIEKINQVLGTDLPEHYKKIGKYLEDKTNKKLTLKFKYKYNNLNFKVVENKKNHEQKIEIIRE
ncbi:hemolysin family protein [Mesomycoplasma lagogenitalium]|uniref:Hemolysin family protein n=1 Tax=Mesomycoplasma lagogenitalium TaxID=171286 RepID=A0ABY8LU84_9BACT|nr:hemolysin family protein [Mesomycoplasma lagogenitalium]WGI36804.1 hemolysin family protein [Mesomycoplasma lagogenitalium]